MKTLNKIDLTIYFSLLLLSIFSIMSFFGNISWLVDIISNFRLCYLFLSLILFVFFIIKKNKLNLLIIIILVIINSYEIIYLYIPNTETLSPSLNCYASSIVFSKNSKILYISVLCQKRNTGAFDTRIPAGSGLCLLW